MNPDRSSAPQRISQVAALQNTQVEAAEGGAWEEISCLVFQESANTINLQAPLFSLVFFPIDSLGQKSKHQGDTDRAWIPHSGESGPHRLPASMKVKHTGERFKELNYLKPTSLKTTTERITHAKCKVTKSVSYAKKKKVKSTKITE